MTASDSVTNVLISTSMKHDGASSLAVIINAPADDTTFAGGGNLEGWMSASDSVSNVLISTSMKHDGPSSLAVIINAPADETTFAGGGVQVALCAGADLAGLTVTAWVYLATTNPPPTQNRYVTFNSSVPDATPANWTQNSWVKFTTSLTQGSTLSISYGAVGGFVGTMYIDSVTITGP